MPKVVKHRCSNYAVCNVMTANAGGTCTKCLNNRETSKRGAATVRLLNGSNGVPAKSRAQRLGRAYQSCRVLLPRRSKEDWS